MKIYFSKTCIMCYIYVAINNEKGNVFYLYEDINLSIMYIKSFFSSFRDYKRDSSIEKQ